MIAKNINPAIEQEVSSATLAKDASRLDRALRAQLHFANRGSTIDTTAMRFSQVELIDKDFYELGKLIDFTFKYWL